MVLQKTYFELILKFLNSNFCKIQKQQNLDFQIRNYELLYSNLRNFKYKS